MDRPRPSAQVRAPREQVLPDDVAPGVVLEHVEVRRVAVELVGLLEGKAAEVDVARGIHGHAGDGVGPVALAVVSPGPELLTGGAVLDGHVVVLAPLRAKAAPGDARRVDVAGGIKPDGDAA